MYEIHEMKDYIAIREKAMLEGALAYINELTFELKHAETLEDVKQKVEDDALLIASELAGHLWNELGFIVNFKFKELQRKETAESSEPEEEQEAAEAK